VIKLCQLAGFHRD